MYIYNISTKVDLDIVQEWISWQKLEEIPNTMSTKLFTTHRIFKLLLQEDNGSETFVIQFSFDLKENYEEYLQKYQNLSRRSAVEKWGDGIVSFITIMEAVQ